MKLRNRNKYIYIDVDKYINKVFNELKNNIAYIGNIYNKEINND